MCGHTAAAAARLRCAHGAEVVGDLVGRGARVRHLEEHDGVDGDHQVVLGDHRLRREGDDLLAHVDERLEPVDVGHQQRQPGAERALVATQPLDDAVTLLTERETELLGLLSKGYTVKEIAQTMAIPWFSVNDHIRTVYRKLERASSPAEALRQLRRELSD